MIKFSESINLPVSTAKPIYFTPAHYDGLQNPPIYLLQVPDILQRADMDHEIVCRAGKFNGDEYLREKLKECIEDIVSADQQPELNELLDQYQYQLEQREKDLAFTIDPTLVRDIIQLEESMERHHPLYRELISARTRWFKIAPVIAVQMFLLGRKDEELFARSYGKLSDGVLESLPKNDIYAIGFHILSATKLSEAQRKNSDSPLH